MHYVIYKTTNLINGKFYIGKHQTKDISDGYIGSGKLLKYAIKKYGSDQFKTEIILECISEAYMNLAEKILVVIDPEVSYNLCRGGRGGFGYINSSGIPKFKGKKHSLEVKERLSLLKKGQPSNFPDTPWNKGIKGHPSCKRPKATGVMRSLETRLKISEILKKTGSF